MQKLGFMVMKMNILGHGSMSEMMSHRGARMA